MEMLIAFLANHGLAGLSMLLYILDSYFSVILTSAKLGCGSIGRVSVQALQRLNCEQVSK